MRKMRNKKKSEKRINKLKEIEIMLSISKQIIDEIKKNYPNLSIGEPYNGKYLPYILEYVNTFIYPDAKPF